MRISDWSSDGCSSDLHDRAGCRHTHAALPCDWMQVEAVRRLVRDEGGSMSTPPLKMRNIGPNSAASLRQVGLRTPEDLAEADPLAPFLPVHAARINPIPPPLYALDAPLTTRPSQ